MSSQAAAFLPFSVSLLHFVYLSGWVGPAVLIFNFSYLPSLSVSFHTSLPGNSSSLEFMVPTTIQREKQIQGQSVCQEP